MWPLPLLPQAEFGFATRAGKIYPRLAKLFFTVRRQPNLSEKLSAACLGVARRAKTGADSWNEIAAARRNEIVPIGHNEIHAGA